MSIIENAIDSIQIGIEDYESADDRRSISAVRNISAGILLLYKEKLYQLSPEDNKELLIKQNIRRIKNDNGEMVFEGKGHKTVDVSSIQERFKRLGVIVEWDRFNEINKLRNDLEHYYTSESPDTVREVVAKSFLLIRDFLTEYLKKDPQETLGTESWLALLEVSEVYSAEEKLCNVSIEKIDWKYDSVKNSLKYLRCNKCHSSLIEASYPEEDGYPTVNLHCRSCDNDFSADDIIEQCIDDSLAGQAIRNAMDGGESPYDSCYECGKNTYIHSENCCIACEYELEYKFCEVCDTSLDAEDQYNEGKCSSCQHSYDKWMAD
jgi:hypothetical protein